MAVLRLFVIILAATCCMCYPQENRLLWKLETESRTISKRDHDDDCPLDVYFCPKTSPSVMTPGDPSQGQDLFRKDYFDDVCSYIPEFLKCAEDYHDNRSPVCEDRVRSVVKLLSLREMTLCKSPILPIAREIRPCLNRKVTTLTPFYDRVMDLIISSERNTTYRISKTNFCQSYREIIKDTITELKTCEDFQWSAKKEVKLRRFYYPALSWKRIPFQCENL